MRTPTFGVLLNRLNSSLDAARQGTQPGGRIADLLQEVIGDVRVSADLPRRPDHLEGPDASDVSGVLQAPVPEELLEDVTARIESAGIRLTF